MASPGVGMASPPRVGVQSLLSLSASLPRLGAPSLGGLAFSSVGGRAALLLFLACRS